MKITQITQQQFQSTLKFEILTIRSLARVFNILGNINRNYQSTNITIFVFNNGTS